MARIYRLGVIGFAHMHINELMRAFADLPTVECVACSDTRPRRPELVEARFTRGWNLKHGLETIGIPRAYEDYQDMLSQERFDIVLFCPENARHGEVAEAIAAHGAHLLTEKPMAASLAEARRMARAAEAAGVTLMVNWPTTWSSAARTARRLVEEGAIGRLWEVRWRGGSMGPLARGSSHPGVGGTAVEMTDEALSATWWYQRADGGGALLDYCCYGACLSRWYMGRPAEAAVAMTANVNSTFGDAEDNAVITVRFPDGLAVLEATWSTVDHGAPTGPILYGTEGTLLVERRRDEPEVVRLLRGKYGPPQEITADPLPPGRDTLAREFIHHLETGEPLHETLQVGFNLQAQAILEAGIRSAASGKLEPVERVE